MIPYIEIHLVDHCNLKCKGCSHFSGLAPEIYKNYDEFQTEMQILANCAQVHTIRLMGGEPLLHPHVIDFCTTTRKLFPTSEIVLVSNGILLPINVLNNNKIALCLSNYGLKLDWNQINKFKIHYFHKKNNMYNISLDLSGSQDPAQTYPHCDLVQGKWYFYKNGRLFQCCIMANIEYFCNYFNKAIEYDLDDISIDVATHTEQEIQDFLAHPHEICKYCNTIARHNSYSRFAISKGDINEWIVG